MRGAERERAGRAPTRARCRNCAGPHLSQANLCQVKREIRRANREWRSPSRERGERASAPPGETTEGPVTEEGEREVEVLPEVEVEGAVEE